MEDLIDPSYDNTYTPSTMTQAVIGASIMLTIALAFYGAAMILQGALNGLH